MSDERWPEIEVYYYDGPPDLIQLAAWKWMWDWLVADDVEVKDSNAPEASGRR
jgi:hypothetical protein